MAKHFLSDDYLVSQANYIYTCGKCAFKSSSQKGMKYHIAVTHQKDVLYTLVTSKVEDILATSELKDSKPKVGDSTLADQLTHKQEKNIITIKFVDSHKLEVPSVKTIQVPYNWPVNGEPPVKRVRTVDPATSKSNIKITGNKSSAKVGIRETSRNQAISIVPSASLQISINCPHNWSWSQVKQRVCCTHCHGTMLFTCATCQLQDCKPKFVYYQIVLHFAEFHKDQTVSFKLLYLKDHNATSLGPKFFPIGRFNISKD